MSKQIVTGGKTKTITSFFPSVYKPIVKEVIHVPHSSVTSRLCEICGKAISNQGWKNHIAKHQRNNDLMPEQITYVNNHYASRKFGKVKLHSTDDKKKAKDDFDNQQGAEDGASIGEEEEMKYLVGEGAGKGAEEGVGKGDVMNQKVSNQPWFSNWTIKHKVHILDHFHGDGKGMKNPTLRWATDLYGKTLHKSTLNRWIQNEKDIRLSSHGDRKKHSDFAVSKREGHFPEMEILLAAQIRNMRQSGIRVTSWMVVEDAKELLTQLYPTLHDFKFSNGWFRGFSKRNSFSVRKVNSKKSILQKASIEESVATITNFHLNTRAFQISKFDDPVYGFTSLEATFNRDEVPLALADKNEYTIDNKGLSEILDTTGGEKDCYRSASLCITVPGKIDVDGSNFPKWMIIFRGSFCDGDDWWSEDERKEWHPDVVVSFQENAWMDTASNSIWIKNVMVPMNEYCKNASRKGVLFEDNLSSHKTSKAHLDFANTLDSFAEPMYYDPGFTFCEQVVDRHIGREAQRTCHRFVRSALRKIWAEKNNRVEKLTAREERILLTHAVGQSWNEAKLKSERFERAFTATGTWMPVKHCIDIDGAENGIKDHEVDLQHISNGSYDYSSCITRTNILKRRKELDEKAQDIERRKVNEKRTHLAEELELDKRCSVFSDLGIEMFKVNAEKIYLDATTTISKFGPKIDATEFFIVGSWPASIVAKFCSSKSDPVTLVTNDIDVFIPQEANSNWLTGSNFTIHVKSSKKFKAPDMDIEINTVPCSNVTSESLLKNNDINATGVVLRVTASSDKSIFSINEFKISTSFWNFLLSPDHILRVNHPRRYGAKSLVRLAYKSFQMKLPFDSNGLDPFTETIAKSHVDKLKEMENWKESPVFTLKANKAKKGGYELVSRINKKECMKCQTGTRNKQCKFKMCSKCCVRSGSDCPTHKNCLKRDMAKRGILPYVNRISEKTIRNRKFQSLLNSVKHDDEVMRSSRKKPKHEELLRDPPMSRSGLGAVHRFLGNLLTFEFIEEDMLAIEGFMEGNHPGTATMKGTSAARLSSCSKKSATEKFLNDELVNMFGRLVVEMDCENVRKQNFARIGYYNTAFYGQLMMNGTYKHENVMRWSRHQNVDDLFDLEKMFVPVNIPGQHWFLIIVDFASAEIGAFDSNPVKTSRMQYLYNVQRYLNDEWEENKQKRHEKKIRPRWRICDVDVSNNNVQENGFDCGVFTCMFMYFSVMSWPFVIDQAHIDKCRPHLALSFLRQNLTSLKDLHAVAKV